MPMLTTTMPAAIVDAETETPTETSIATSALNRLEEVSRLINCLVAEWGGSMIVHRRTEHRAEFTGSLVLTPFNTATSSPDGEPKLVTGRNVSLHGIAFSHEHPLPYRDIVLTFALPDGGVESMTVRLMWCRFTRDGQYHSGGRLLRPVESPIGQDVDWNFLRRA